MRMLDMANIPYDTTEYTFDENNLSGIDAALKIGLPPQQVFKTLVTLGDKTGVLIFCIPVDMELDLKKCATISKNKKLELIPMKNLLSLTGYIRGGCSPIGMKKHYPTFIEETAFLFDRIAISAGIRGQQALVAPEDLVRFLNASQGDLCKF